MVVLLTCGVSWHLDDAFAVHPSFPGVEGSDPHRHLDRGPGHVDSGRANAQRSWRLKNTPGTWKGQRKSNCVVICLCWYIKKNMGMVLIIKVSRHSWDGDSFSTGCYPQLYHPAETRRSKSAFSECDVSFGMNTLSSPAFLQENGCWFGGHHPLAASITEAWWWNCIPLMQIQRNFIYFGNLLTRRFRTIFIVTLS